MRARLASRTWVVVWPLVALAMALYLGWSWSYGELGFPLDDGWIHQTYARNLAAYHQWAYNPGEVSAGSTSPLWTLLLALGYALRLDFRLWTFLLGAALLGATAWTACRLARALFPDAPQLPWLVAAFCGLEWHLGWAALSGMETLLFSALGLAVLESWLAGKRGWAVGLMGGLLTLSRPEGAMLAGIVGAAMLLQDVRAGRSSRWLAFGASFAALLLPYLAFHWAIGGSPFPNTLYAKQAEYAILLANKPWLQRLSELAWTTSIGGQILLVPGFVYALARLIRDRNWKALVPPLWWGSYLALYAWSLPVTYQHGRYLIPCIPILAIYGLWGTLLLFELNPWRLLNRAWGISVAIVTLAFWILGAEAYASDVRIINSEMVATASWIRQHTPSDSLVAAHDIGALGYYGDRKLLDLAGLITPEVIPFIRDEGRLLALLEEKGADYLVTFPSWYPEMVSNPALDPVYAGNSPWVVEAGGDHMTVYRIRWDD